MALVVQHPTLAKQFQKSSLQEMPIVDSQFLQHVAYDADSSQMTVTMKNGAQYVYSSVTPDVMEGFTLAKSKGRFYSDKIRGLKSSQRVVDKSVGPPISKRT